MRKLGLNPTKAELSDLINEIDCDYKGKIDQVAFFDLMNKSMKQSAIEEELAEAFALFDRSDKGYITGWDIKRQLGILGEEMSP